MTSSLSTKTILIVLVVLGLVWFAYPWSSEKQVADDPLESNADASSDTLVSAIQPLSDANAENLDQGVVSGRLNFRAQGSALNDSDLAGLKRRFNESNEAIANGQWQLAITGLETIITDFPTIIEPYLNLASVYAEQQQLENARLTLLRGFEANPKAGLLFDHLKKVHGELAATSYRQALDTKAPSSTQARFSLARVSDIITQEDNSKRIAMLEQQLLDTQSQNDSSINEAQAQKLLALEAKLSEIESVSSAKITSYAKELDALKVQLAEQSQLLPQSQKSERDALARVVLAEQEAATKIADVTKELELQKEMLADAQTLSDQQSTALAKAEQNLQSQALTLQNAQSEIEKIRSAAKLIEQPTVTTASVDANAVDRSRELQAIELVESWARAWSAQDVAAYVSHYAEDYSSSRSITRDQWLEQRRVRLTNKEFINVNVTSFKVKDLGSQFSVTFSQYYQSNTVDDTVFKRLVFDKRSDDWSGAKIVNERLVSG